jgi:hypothetical protein
MEARMTHVGATVARSHALEANVDMTMLLRLRCARALAEDRIVHEIARGVSHGLSLPLIRLASQTHRVR